MSIATPNSRSAWHLLGAPACQLPPPLAIRCLDAVLDLELFECGQRVAQRRFDAVAILRVSVREGLAEVGQWIRRNTVACRGGLDPAGPYDVVVHGPRSTDRPRGPRVASVARCGTAQPPSPGGDDARATARRSDRPAAASPRRRRAPVRGGSPRAWVPEVHDRVGWNGLRVDAPASQFSPVDLQRRRHRRRQCQRCC